MAEKKERKIISASEAKTSRSGGKSEDAPKKPKKRMQVPSGKKKTKGLRITAVILWIAAIGFEVGAIYMLNIAETTPLIIFLVADAACCIVGSLLWKKANHISPCMSDSKFVCFIWNQLGVIMCLLAFIPFGIILLKQADKLTPKMKKVITILFAVLVVGSIGASIDYRPATPSAANQAEQAILEAHPDFDGTVYWTRYGKSFHLDPDGPTIRNSEVIISGTIDEAFEAKRFDPCDFCAPDVDMSGVDFSSGDETVEVVDEAVDDAVDEESKLELAPDEADDAVDDDVDDAA